MTLSAKTMATSFSSPSLRSVQAAWRASEKWLSSFRGAREPSSFRASAKVTQRIRRELPHVGVVVLTAKDEEQTLFEAIRAGAAAYLNKDCDPVELVDAIRKARAGQFIINEKVFNRPAVASKVLGPAAFELA